jgi:hypothetical protein
MTDQQTTPEPIAELSFDVRTVVLFDDGAMIETGVGDWWCSEHTGTLDGTAREAQEKCDHVVGEATNTIPSFSGELLVGAAATDRTIQDEVLQRLAENDPERLAESIEGI